MKKEVLDYVVEQTHALMNAASCSRASQRRPPSTLSPAQISPPATHSPAVGAAPATHSSTTRTPPATHRATGISTGSAQRSRSTSAMIFHTFVFPPLSGRGGGGAAREKGWAARRACRSSALPGGRKKGEPCGSPFIFANRSVRTSGFPERPSAGRRGSDRLPGDQRGILWACGGLRRP